MMTMCWPPTSPPYVTITGQGQRHGHVPVSSLTSTYAERSICAANSATRRYRIKAGFLSHSELTKFTMTGQWPPSAYHVGNRNTPAIATVLLEWIVVDKDNARLYADQNCNSSKVTHAKPWQLLRAMDARLLICSSSCTNSFTALEPWIDR